MNGAEPKLTLAKASLAYSKHFLFNQLFQNFSNGQFSCQLCNAHKRCIYSLDCNCANEAINLFCRYPNDTCCRVNKQGTDVYFHVVDSNSGKVLPYDHPLVQSRITNRQSSSDLKYAVSSRLAIQASNIHPPYPDAPGGLPGSQSIPGLTSGSTDSASNFDGLPAALISIGCLVFAFAFAAVMYLVIMRKK